MIFTKKEVELQISQLKDTTHFSLNLLRKDVIHSFEWIKYLMAQHNEHMQELEHVRKQLRNLSVSNDAFRAKHDLIVQLQQQIQKVDHAVNQNESQSKAILNKIDHLASELQQVRLDIENLKAQGLENPVKSQVSSESHGIVSRDPVESHSFPEKHLHSRVETRNSFESSERIAENVLGLVRERGPIPALELRRIVVEENKWLSKSSFYRLVETMIRDQSLDCNLRGREKILRIP